MKHALLLAALALILPACHAAKSSSTQAGGSSEPPAPAAPAVSPEAQHAIDTGTASPRFRTVDPFTLPAISGGDDFDLSETLAGGEWVALHFLLKTDCPLCLTYTMRFHDARESFPGVRHVFIKPDDERIAKRWVNTARVFAKDLPTIHRDPDAALAKQLNVRFGHPFHGEITHYPCLVLIAPDGRERWRYTGSSTFERATLKQFTAAYEEHVARDR